MEDLNKNSDLKEWAEDTIGWIGKIGNALGSVGSVIYNGSKDFGETIGTMIGGFSEGGFSGLVSAGVDRLNAQEEEAKADNRDRLRSNEV